MATPTLTVLRASQQAIHDFLVSIPGIVGQKCLHFFLRGWKSDQIEIHATQKHPLVRRRHGMQLPLFVLGSNERIDRIVEGCVFHLGHR